MKLKSLFVRSTLSSAIAFAAVLGGAAAHANEADAIRTQPLAIASGFNGQDPDATGCSADGQIVDKTIVTRANGERVGAVRLMYSNRCLTFWTRVISDNGNAFTATLNVRDAVNGYSFAASFPAIGSANAGNSPMADAAGRLGVAKARIELPRVAVEALTRECGAPGTINACAAR